jgi:hypothetical protein
MSSPGELFIVVASGSPGDYPKRLKGDLVACLKKKKKVAYWSPQGSEVHGI